MLIHFQCILEMSIFLKGQTHMTDLYNRIVGQRSSFENLMLKVPGYRGYKEAMDRRAADRMMRDHIVKLLKEQMNHLVDVEKKILTAGGLSQASKTHEAKLKFQTFIDRVNTATPGYAGFFDAKKIGEEELDMLYKFDTALLAYTDKFKAAIDALETAAGESAALPGAISALEALGTEANSAYALRDNVLTGIS
ncbi:MAG: hypothetical protein ABI947_05185 [Chloroflexota bacterium]